MKKILSIFLVVSILLFSNAAAFAANEQKEIKVEGKDVIYKGRITQATIREDLEKLGVPVEVINDIEKNSSKQNAKDYIVEISVAKNSPVPEGRILGYQAMSTVYYQSYESKYYNAPLDAIVSGTSATSISEIVITSAGMVFSKVSLFSGGISILQNLQKLWGTNSVYPQSGDYVEIDGSLSARTDKYTYCDLNDGSGYRLGLISQKIENMSMTFEAHAFNRLTRSWENEIVYSMSNKNFVSNNFTSPNSKALSNARLNMSEDQRFTITVKNVKFEIK